MPLSDNTKPDPLSKTRRKNDMHDLQKLGVALVALPATRLAKLPLPDKLLEAIEMAHKLKSHESIRRHMQYIGKIMRSIDPEIIALVIKKLK